MEFEFKLLVVTVVVVLLEPVSVDKGIGDGPDPGVFIGKETQ